MIKPQSSFENYYSQKNNLFGSQKSKTTPKSRQNEMTELNENKKTKVLTPKLAHMGPKSKKNQPVN